LIRVLSYLVGDKTSKQNLRSESNAGLTEHIRKSSSIIVNKSSPEKILIDKINLQQDRIIVPVNT